MEDNTKYRKLITSAYTRHVDWNFATKLKTKIKRHRNTRPQHGENL